MVATESQKKAQIANVCITIAICLLFNFITVFVVLNDGVGVSQVQTVNINTDKEKVDLNTASKYELESLPNIGEKMAQSIIDNRPYKSVYDLKIINGIGSEIVNNLKEVVTCK